MQYVTKGAARVCGCVEVVNDDYVPTSSPSRLIPRTEDLPLYTTAEFNKKVSSMIISEALPTIP